MLFCFHWRTPLYGKCFIIGVCFREVRRWERNPFFFCIWTVHWCIRCKIVMQKFCSGLTMKCFLCFYIYWRYLKWFGSNFNLTISESLMIESRRGDFGVRYFIPALTVRSRLGVDKRVWLVILCRFVWAAGQHLIPCYGLDWDSSMIIALLLIITLLLAYEPS